MTDKELRHLSRRELLEMLIEQGKELERLRKVCEDQKKELENRSLIQNQAGSMAEASLVLNGIFRAADEAAKQYLENVEQYCKEKKADFDPMIHLVDSGRIFKEGEILWKTDFDDDDLEIERT